VRSILLYALRDAVATVANLPVRETNIRSHIRFGAIFASMLTGAATALVVKYVPLTPRFYVSRAAILY
jgi:hypothetical protein